MYRTHQSNWFMIRSSGSTGILKMLHFLPGPIKGAIAIFLISTNTLVWCLSLIPPAIIRRISPTAFKPFWTRLMSSIADCWIIVNNVILDLTQQLALDVQGLENLHRDRWYLVTCNHQTWADILLLQRICLHRIPMLKFFLKQILIWVPVIGIAWWALDFPFMKRYTREQIERQPELQGTDLETTRMACEVFKTSPVSVLNFLEHIVSLILCFRFGKAGAHRLHRLKGQVNGFCRSGYWIRFGIGDDAIPGWQFP